MAGNDNNAVDAANKKADAQKKADEKKSSETKSMAQRYMDLRAKMASKHGLTGKLRDALKSVTPEEKAKWKEDCKKASDELKKEGDPPIDSIQTAGDFQRALRRQRRVWTRARENRAKEAEAEKAKEAAKEATDKPIEATVTSDEAPKSEPGQDTSDSAPGVEADANSSPKDGKPDSGNPPDAAQEDAAIAVAGDMFKEAEGEMEHDDAVAAAGDMFKRAEADVASKVSADLGDKSPGVQEDALDILDEAEKKGPEVVAELCEAAGVSDPFAFVDQALRDGEVAINDHLDEAKDTVKDSETSPAEKEVAEQMVSKLTAYQQYQDNKSDIAATKDMVRPEISIDQTATQSSKAAPSA